MDAQFKSGFATVVGRPNVGKSTLVNYIMGEKVSIVTDKIQTTRHTIQGVLTEEDMQLILIDTPGIHKPKHRLGHYMVDTSLNTLRDVDIVLFMMNVVEGFGKGDAFILEQLNKIDTPKFLIMNKVDHIEPNDILPLIDLYKDKCDFEEIIPISALNGNNVSTLLTLIKEYLPHGPKYFEDNQLTNRSERFMVSELIREKILVHTEEEIPHSVNVVVESMGEREGKKHIQATIIVERDSQKGIIIGKKGSMLKKIGREARLDIEKLINQKVFLELWVRVERDWRNKQNILTRYGFQLNS